MACAQCSKKICGVVTTRFPPHTGEIGGQQATQKRGATMATRRTKFLSRAATAFALFFVVGAANCDAQSPPAAEADILIKNGRVMDGTGAPWFQADIAIAGDRIVYVGRAPVKARRVIDAGGKIVSPGFIDMHSHSEFGLSMDGRALSKITQGITTEVMGEHLSAGPVLDH